MASVASAPGKQILTVTVDLPFQISGWQFALLPQFSVVHEIIAFLLIQVFIIVRT